MTSVVTIELGHLAELQSKLARAPALIDKMIGEELERSAGGIHKRLFTYTQDYPQKPYGSLYERTFKLMHSGQYRVYKRSARIWSGLDYAGAVLGYDTQIDLHAGRWWTNKTVVDEMADWIGQNFAQGLKRVAESIGTGSVLPI